MCVAGTTISLTIPNNEQEYPSASSIKKRRLSATDRKRRVQFGIDATTIHTVPSLAEVAALKDSLWYSTGKLNSLLEQELQRNYALLPTRGTNSSHHQEGTSVVADWLSLSWRGLEWHQQECGMQIRRAHIRSHVQVILTEYHRDPTSADKLCFVSESLSEMDRQMAYQRGLDDAACIISRETTTSSKDSATTTMVTAKIISVDHHVLWWLRFIMIFLICGAFLMVNT